MRRRFRSFYQETLLEGANLEGIVIFDDENG